MDTLKQLFGYMGTRKKYWLFPVIIVLFLIGGLLVFSSGSALAPFVYTLF